MPNHPAARDGGWVVTTGTHAKLQSNHNHQHTKHLFYR